MEANNFDLREKVAPGTGPFMLNDIKQDEYWDLDANPDYFVPHLPYADGARLLNVIPFCDRGTAVLTGQADFTWNTCGDVIKIALERPDLDAKYATGDIFFMSRGWNIEKKPFDDVRVEKGLPSRLRPRRMDRHLYGGRRQDVPPHHVGAILRFRKRAGP